MTDRRATAFRSGQEDTHVVGCDPARVPAALQFTPGATTAALMAALASRVQTLSCTVGAWVSVEQSATRPQELALMLWPLADEIELIVGQLQRAAADADRGTGCVEPVATRPAGQSMPCAPTTAAAGDITPVELLTRRGYAPDHLPAVLINLASAALDLVPRPAEVEARRAERWARGEVVSHG